MTTITTTLQHIDPEAVNFGDPSSFRIITVSVRNGRYSLKDADPYALGCKLHAALQRYEDFAPLTDTERSVWPYAAELRGTLENLGVQRIRAERPLKAWSGVPHGTCDLYLSGGLRRHGISEVKVVRELPDQPRPLNSVQLGGYLWLATREEKFEHWWGCLAYVSFLERKIRLFTYRDIRPLAIGAGELFRAAA